MPAHYIATAHPATSVQHSVRCNFLQREQETLIISKNTRLEIYSLEADSLKLQLEVPINGRITNLKALQFKSQSTARLLVTVEHYKLAVLAYDPESKSVSTEESRDTSERAGRPSDCGQLCAIDHDSSMAALLLYNGLLKIIVFDETKSAAQPVSPSAERRKRSLSTAIASSKGKESSLKAGSGSIIKDIFNVRLQELNVHAIAFIQPEGSDQDETLGAKEDPIIAILSQSPKQTRSVAFYTVSQKEKDLVPYPLTSQSKKLTDSVDAGAELLVPLSGTYRGLFIVGESTLQWVCIQGMEATSKTETFPTLIAISTCSWLSSSSRLCLGDEGGHLYETSVSRKGLQRILQVQARPSTRLSSPSTMTYLTEDIMFLGSHFSDSQLIRLERSRTSIFVQELERFMNLAPIADFIIRKDEPAVMPASMDVDGKADDSSQVGTLVTCSGWQGGGSLRIVRHGVGISERAIIDVEAIGKIWTLKSRQSDLVHSHLLLDSPGQSSLLEIDDEEGFVDTDVEQLRGYSPQGLSLAVANLTEDVIVQVTSHGIHFTSLVTELHREAISFEGTANLACVAGQEVAVAFPAGLLVKYSWVNNTLKQTCRTQFPQEISSICAAPDLRLCAVGLWTINAVAILSLDDLSVLSEESLQVDLPPRDMLFVAFTEVDARHLIVASGNGNIHTFVVDPKQGVLQGRKSVNVGLRPATLTDFDFGYGRGVFVSCDRPTVISHAKDKLSYSAVNLKNVLDVVALRSTAFQSCLAILTDQEIQIASIDNVEKLHVRNVPLGDEMPLRIAHQPSHNIYGVLTVRQHFDGQTGFESERSYVRIFDHDTFQSRAQYSLPDNETVQSIASTSFEGTSEEYFAVGTTLENPEAANASQADLANNIVAVDGRVLLFEARRDKITLVAEHPAPGCVFALAGFNGALAAAVNSQVLIYTVTRRSTGLVMQQTTSFGSPYAVCYLSVLDQYLILGDLMRSISLLEYDSVTKRLKEVGRDYNGHWMTAIEALDVANQEFIGAEDGLNLFTVARASEQSTRRNVNAINRLELRGQFHLGESVNKIRRGIVAEVGGTETSNHLVFVTVFGMIGVVATLTDRQSQFLTRLQENMKIAVRPVGGFDHAEWRMFKNSRRRADAVGFIDGDYIERFLDLSTAQQQAVLNGLNEAEKLPIPLEEACQILEGLSRIH